MAGTPSQAASAGITDSGNDLHPQTQEEDTGEADHDGPTHKEAFVTLVTTSKYLIGAEVLAKCLRSFRASRPLLALVDASLPVSSCSLVSIAGAMAATWLKPLAMEL